MRWLISISLLLSTMACDQPSKVESSDATEAYAEGNLFIIGGGSRSLSLMKEMVDLSVSPDGYILVMSQSSSEPDTSFYYVAKQFRELTARPIRHVDSLQIQLFDLDSIRNADLIYMTGGDQNRFKRNVPQEAVEAMKTAYQNGATIAGTSAGAALMSAVMITGDQKNEPEYESTYRRLEYDNAITTEGLGFLDSVVVDQHFVARSRYNRILSLMADLDYPIGAGIEESTALVVYPKGATVVGEGQVVVFERPKGYRKHNNKIGFKDMNLNAYLEGDTFQLN
ncbi:MAG: cyanophycinase [Flavobacteriales bacterium]|nr:cyanophycinase [Flavobacteriales bacterium]